jgi:Uma2 family endonuclease
MNGHSKHAGPYLVPEGEHLEVCSEPSPAGYLNSQTLRRGHFLARQAFPDLELAVDIILG